MTAWKGRYVMSFTALPALQRHSVCRHRARRSGMVPAAIVRTRWLLPTREAVLRHLETSHRIEMLMPAAVILSGIVVILLLIPPARGTGPVSPDSVVAGLAFTTVLGAMTAMIDRLNPGNPESAIKVKISNLAIKYAFNRGIARSYERLVLQPGLIQNLPPFPTHLSEGNRHATSTGTHSEHRIVSAG